MTVGMLRSYIVIGFSWWPTCRGDVTPLGGSESASEEGATWSTLVKLTPLELESEASESEVDEALTRCLASHVPLGWVGILWPLPSVAP